MKRFLCLALVLALLMITLPVRAEKLTALWTANPKISAPIYSEPSTQSKTLGRIYQGASVKVYSFDPEWAYINSSGVVGYVLRRHLESGKAIDSSHAALWRGNVRVCRHSRRERRQGAYRG